MSRIRYSTFALSMCCAMALSLAGHAQSAGTYTGSSADGQLVRFVVGTDGDGHLAVINASVNFQAPCKGGSAPTLENGWGFSPDAVITHHKADMVSPDPYFYITASFVFSGSSVTGLITTRVPYLDPANTPPVRADFCESPKQAFSATLGADPALDRTPAPGQVVHLREIAP